MDNVRVHPLLSGDSIVFDVNFLDECVEWCEGQAVYEYQTIATGPPYGEVLIVTTATGSKFANHGDTITKSNGVFDVKHAR